MGEGNKRAGIKIYRVGPHCYTVVLDKSAKKYSNKICRDNHIHYTSLCLLFEYELTHRSVIIAKCTIIQSRKILFILYLYCIQAIGQMVVCPSTIIHPYACFLSTQISDNSQVHDIASQKNPVYFILRFLHLYCIQMVVCIHITVKNFNGVKFTV